MIITYVGKEQCDILYHLVKIGKKLGKSIVVFDNSITHDFYMMFDKNDGKDVIEQNNLVVCKDRVFKREEKTYDYVFVYEGLYPKYNGFIDIAIVAPSYAKQEWDMIKPHLENCKMGNIKTFLVLRDRVNRKITPRIVKKMLNIEPYYSTSIELSDKDYSAYVCMTHNKKAVLPKKGELEDTIFGLASEIYHLDDIKKLRNLVK